MFRDITACIFSEVSSWSLKTHRTHHHEARRDHGCILMNGSQSESWADSGRAPAGPGPSGGHGPALGYEEARTGKAGHPVSPLGQGQYCPRDVRNGCESTGWGQGGGHWRWCLQEWALGGLSAWGRWERECEADVKQCVCLCVCEMQWGVYVTCMFWSTI